MAADGFKIGDAFISLGAKVNEKAVSAAIDTIGKNLTSMLNTEMDRIQNLGHTTATKTAAAMQVGFAGVGLHLFGEVETGLAEVTTLSGKVGAEGREHMDGLRQGVYELSREMGISQSEIIPGMYDAISAGIPKENIFDFMRVSNKLAIGGVSDTGTAVDGLTTILNAFGMDAEDAGLVADMMFTTVRNGKTTIDELAGSMFQVAPIANAAGVGLDEVNAAMGTLTLSGTPTSVAATQVRSAIQGLLRPSEDMTAIMNEAGYESAQAAIEQEGLAGALAIVEDAVGGDVGQMTTLLGSIEAVQAATGILADDSGEYTRQLGEQQNALGATEDAYSTVADTQNRGMTELKVAWENFAIVIGEAVAPMFGRLSDVVKKVTDFFSRLPKPVQQGIAAFTMLATVLGPPLFMFYRYYRIWKLIRALAMARNVTQLSSAFKAGTPLLQKFITKVTGVGRAVKSFNKLKFMNNIKTGAVNAGNALKGGFTKALAGAKAGAIKAFAAMKTAAMSSYAFIMAHPFIAIAAAVIAIVTLIILNWDKIKEWFMKFWNWFKSTFVFDWLVAAFTWVRDIALSIWEAIKTATSTFWNWITGFIGAAFDLIKGFFLNFTGPGLIIKHWDTIKNATTKVWNIIKGFVSGVINAIKTVITTVFNFLKSYFTTVMNVYKTIFTTVWNAIKTVITAVWNALKAAASAVWNAIKSYFTTVLNIYKTIFTTVWNVIKSVVMGVWNALKDGASRIFNAIKDTITTIWDKIKGFITTAVDFIREKILGGFQRAKDGVTTTIGNLLDTVKELPGKIIGALGNVGRMLYDSGKKIIQGLIDGILNMGKKVKDAVGGVLDKARDLLPFSPAKEGPFSGKGWTLHSGKSMMQALAKGIESEKRAVEQAMTSSLGAGKQALTATSPSASSSSATTHNNFNITINGANMSPSEIEAMLNRQLNNLWREAAVHGAGAI